MPKIHAAHAYLGIDIVLRSFDGDAPVLQLPDQTPGDALLCPFYAFGCNLAEFFREDPQQDFRPVFIRRLFFPVSQKILKLLRTDIREKIQDDLCLLPLMDALHRVTAQLKNGDARYAVIRHLDFPPLLPDLLSIQIHGYIRLHAQPCPLPEIVPLPDQRDQRRKDGMDLMAQAPGQVVAAAVGPRKV